MMDYIHDGLQRISDGNGVFLSITGMLIVFVALSFISVFIASLPRILALVSRFFPDQSAKAIVDDERVAIAISVALHHQKYVSKD